jgi:potassium-dependent mechanosensitive channel
MHVSSRHCISPLLPKCRLALLVVMQVWAYGHWFPAPIACAQEAAPETLADAAATAAEVPDDRQGAETNSPISLEEVPARAETTIAELATLLPSASSRRTLERVGGETDLALNEVKLHLAKTRQMLAGRPNLRALQKSSAELGETLNRLQSLEEQLEDELDGFGISLGRIDKIAAVWKTTDELAKTEEGADETMLARIAAVLGEIDETRSAVVDRRNELLTARDELVNPSVALGESIEQLQATVEARLTGIFRADHPPLWDSRVRESFQKEWQTIGPQLLIKRFKESRQILRKPTQTRSFQLVLFLESLINNILIH